eukprot:1112780-Prorocentrum_minimum.AAC.1
MAEVPPEEFEKIQLENKEKNSLIDILRTKPRQNTKICEWLADMADKRATLAMDFWNVWALAVRKDGGEVATGGGDGRINMWHDNTAVEAEEAALLTEAQLLKQQQMDNAGSNGQLYGVRVALFASPLVARGRTLRVKQRKGNGVVTESVCPRRHSAVRNRDYAKAVALGFELQQPARLRQLFEQMLQKEKASAPLKATMKVHYIL